ncbi:bifunctional chorismate mutase/prephenate dehydratase [Flexilinea flocculi]|jgi:chorismate mutase/prephenate dehydratase|uniref:Bifunctional chorismate mutase/prephenate dehydratase n=1 Tax=Flexilinea flocculi TaxID=1678840 RepID=A0A0K8P9E3_9CHLR|nr:bifunctional chorismate mutase/prephenate dehydratase [Flexilinea flocculi]NMB93225.1 bifunctional chorismate mutase/prephenate dehydratase [Flexilinea flocculi]GAP39273.1 prephenate dehydratase [Flexilinea flocculi]
MEIQEIRSQIDEIDKQIVNLVVKRMKMALQAAEYKQAHQLPLLDRKREREILVQTAELAGEEYAGYAKVLFSTLFDLSKSYQNRILVHKGKLADEIAAALVNTAKQFPSKAVVACQGIEGAYSQMACDRIFSLPNILYFRHFEGVFQAVQNGLCRYGILPIENSSYGSVTMVYDLMKKYDFHIAKSLKMLISHSLLAKPDTRMDMIKEIVSHEQAIGQCSEFLRGHKDIKITVCENTAIAAQMVANSDRTDIAAISSKNCADLYGLTVLNDSIQNSEINYTRFICISKELEIYPGADKISLMLTLPHRPGSLYTTIAKFAALGLNLTKLESRPIPGKDFEFMFYFDFDASIYSDEVIRLLCDLEAGPDQFEFLGSYSEI